MASKGYIAAFAIEDRVDFCFLFDDTIGPLHFSEIISEEREYFSEVRRLMEQCLRSLVMHYLRGRPRTPGIVRELFNITNAIAVSVPGVVVENDTVTQLPLWNFASSAPGEINWEHDGIRKRDFSFRTEISDIIQSLIEKNNDLWDADHWGLIERQRFSQRIYVVNDTTACAAFEYTKRYNDKDSDDFIYVKAHNGLNVGVVEQFADRDDIVGFTVKTVHAEAGHTYPVPHNFDNESHFEGVCPFHGSCLEGLVSSNSILKRAEHPTIPLFKTWATCLSLLDYDLRSERSPHPLLDAKQHRERLFVDIVLGERFVVSKRKTKKLDQEIIDAGVDLVAHYVTQLVHPLSVGPFAPTKIIIGGRLAKPRVIEAVRDKLVRWSHGYPKRVSLTSAGVIDHIVGSNASADEDTKIELQGALAIAKARAALPLEWGATRLPLARSPFPI